MDGSSAPLPRECPVGTALPCECPDAPPGFQFCLAEDGVFGECECAPPASSRDLDAGVPDDGGDASTSEPGTGSCVADDDEWCDARDNDCDARVDEGHVCPDSTLAHTLPHDLVVWLRGVGAARDERSRVLQRFWPEPGGASIPVPEAQELRFDRTNALFFSRYGVGIRRSVGHERDVEVATPPCFDGAGGGFLGFDASNRIYYVCGDTIRRGDGELVLDERPLLTNVYGSGRYLVSNFDSFRVYDVDGTELGRFDPSEWVGELRIVGTTVVVGDSAFLAFNRSYRGATRREIVVYRVDDDGSSHLVRRIPVLSAMAAGVALPDGTFVGLRVRDDTGVAFLFPASGAATWLRRDPEQVLFDTRSSFDSFVAGPPSIAD